MRGKDGEGSFKSKAAERGDSIKRAVRLLVHLALVHRLEGDQCVAWAGETRAWSRTKRVCVCVCAGSAGKAAPCPRAARAAEKYKDGLITSLVGALVSTLGTNQAFCEARFAWRVVFGQYNVECAACRWLGFGSQRWLFVRDQSGPCRSPICVFGHAEQLCGKSPREMPGGSAAGSVGAAGPSGCRHSGDGLCWRCGQCVCSEQGPGWGTDMCFS